MLACLDQRNRNPKPFVWTADADLIWGRSKDFVNGFLTEDTREEGVNIIGRLYCTQKAMWKLGCFLRDFLYDPELLAHEQLEETALPGLRGIVTR